MVVVKDFFLGGGGADYRSKWVAENTDYSEEQCLNFVEAKCIWCLELMKQSLRSLAILVLNFENNGYSLVLTLGTKTL